MGYGGLNVSGSSFTPSKNPDNFGRCWWSLRHWKDSKIQNNHRSFTTLSLMRSWEDPGEDSSCGSWQVHDLQNSMDSRKKGSCKFTGVGLIPLAPEQLRERWTSNESCLDQGLEFLKDKEKKKGCIFFFFLYYILSRELTPCFCYRTTELPTIHDMAPN